MTYAQLLCPLAIVEGRGKIGINSQTLPCNGHFWPRSSMAEQLPLKQLVERSSRSGTIYGRFLFCTVW